MASILFATPCFGGQVFAPHFQSCMRLTQDLTQLGLEHDWLIRWNESLVHRARMGMTAEFLKADHTHMMWLDADIEFTSDDVAKLWNMDADIAVGVYAMKKEGAGYAAWFEGELITDIEQFDKPIEVDYAGTGFMMIKMEVFYKLHEVLKAQEKRFLNIIDGLSDEDASFMRQFVPWESYENEMPDIPALYMTPIRDGVLLSEDYFFCALARENGYKVMMDTSVRLGHWGLKRYGA